jgi:DNA-binding PadR family transcriptional regulator
MATLRKTLATRAVVDVLLKDPCCEIHAYSICQATGFASGVVVPIMRRLERHGHLTSWTETEQAARELARRPRRYYRLTDEGAQYLERWRETNGKVPL